MQEEYTIYYCLLQQRSAPSQIDSFSLLADCYRMISYQSDQRFLSTFFYMKEHSYEGLCSVHSTQFSSSCQNWCLPNDFSRQTQDFTLLLSGQLGVILYNTKSTDFHSQNQCLKTCREKKNTEHMKHLLNANLIMAFYRNTVLEADNSILLCQRYFPSMKFVPSRILGTFQYFLSILERQYQSCH